MTNYEKYKSEIEKITRMGRDIGVEKATNKITACGSLNCEECLFLQYGSNCAARAMNGLMLNTSNQKNLIGRKWLLIHRYWYVMII